jgi:multiple sugar transport system permease protein
MAVRPQRLEEIYERPAPLTRLRNFIDRENVFAWIILAPALLVLFLFIAYPFVLGIWLSLTDKKVSTPGNFVGISNFISDLGDTIFQKTVINTFVYTIVATIFKLALGMVLALLMNQPFRGKNMVRAFVLLPWIVPTVLSTVAWQWMFDPSYSILNWMLKNWFAWKGTFPSWLGDPFLALCCVIGVNIWRGVPFFAISLLAGLQTVSVELFEAAAIDGANAFQRFWHITVPTIRPVLLIVTLFSVVWTFADFQLVYVLTRGGPLNSTQLFATYAYDTALRGGQLGVGASIALFMFPILAIVVFIIQRYLNRKEA